MRRPVTWRATTTCSSTSAWSTCVIKGRSILVLISNIRFLLIWHMDDVDFSLVLLLHFFSLFHLISTFWVKLFRPKSNPERSPLRNSGDVPAAPAGWNVSSQWRWGRRSTLRLMALNQTRLLVDFLPNRVGVPPQPAAFPLQTDTHGDSCSLASQTATSFTWFRLHHCPCVTSANLRSTDATECCLSHKGEATATEFNTWQCDEAQHHHCSAQLDNEQFSSFS